LAERKAVETRREICEAKWSFKMIGTSVNTHVFTEAPIDERFRVEPPTSGTASLVSDPMEITRSSSGDTNVSPTFDTESIEAPSVEKTLDDVIHRCERELRVRPDDQRLQVNLALALLNRGYRNDGIAQLEMVLAKHPTNFVALNTLAAARFHGGDLEQSHELYQRILDLYPNSSAAPMGLASIAVRRDDFLDASEHLERAVKIAPKLTTAQYLLAMIQLKLNKPQKAISVLRRALREDVRSPELNQGLGVAFLLVGDPRRAERAFLAALSLNPELASAIHGLSLLLLQERRFEEAIEVLQRRLTAFPTDIQGRELLSHAFVTCGMFKLARLQMLKLLNHFESEKPPNKKELARLNNNVGFCLASEGKFYEAHEKLLLSLNYDQYFGVQPYENLARLYLTQNRFDKALETIDASLANGLDSTSLRLLRELVLVNLGRHKDAVRELNQIISKGDAPASAYADLGWLLSDWEDDYDTAILVLNEGIKRWSHDQKILNNLAYAHLMKGDSNSAREILDSIEELRSDSPYTIATRGLLSLIEGDIETGEQYYTRAEKIAQNMGNQDLALAVKQKKFLELGKAYIRNNDRLRASECIKKGMALEQAKRTFPFALQLKQLAIGLPSPSKEAN
jgi:tetratricopeptide (TPR) repeat protein